jgi:type II secretion system protein I
MGLSQQKLIVNKGFSLLEVAVALLILSTSVIAIYQFISSTQLSSYSIEERVIARELVNNRIALMQTIDPPLTSGKRTGLLVMYGDEWIWEEETHFISRDLTEFSISIINKSKQKKVFTREGYIERK